MKKYVWTFLIITSAAMLWDLVYAQEAMNIKSVSADFVQEKHLKILAKPLISKGKLLYQTPGSLRWEYASPVRSILLVHEGEAKRYVIKDNEIIEDSSAKMQSMHIVMDEITRWLSGRFDENPDFAVEGKTKRKIVLKPVKEALLKIIQRIDIHLSRTPGIIDSVVIYEGESSYTQLHFKNVTLNKKINNSMFKDI